MTNTPHKKDIPWTQFKPDSLVDFKSFLESEFDECETCLNPPHECYCEQQKIKSQMRA